MTIWLVFANLVNQHHGYNKYNRYVQQYTYVNTTDATELFMAKALWYAVHLVSKLDAKPFLFTTPIKLMTTCAVYTDSGNSFIEFMQAD